MSDAAVEEHSREAFHLQEYAEGVIDELETHAQGDTLEVAVVGTPAVSHVEKRSFRFWIMTTLGVLGRLRIKRSHAHFYHHPGAGSVEAERYRHSGPNLRFP